MVDYVRWCEVGFGGFSWLRMANDLRGGDGFFLSSGSCFHLIDP